MNSELACAAARVCTSAHGYTVAAAQTDHLERDLDKLLHVHYGRPGCSSSARGGRLIAAWALARFVKPAKHFPLGERVQVWAR